MAVVSELIRCESDGTISFGDYSLETKSKLDNVSHQGDLYKVRSFQRSPNWSEMVCLYMNLFRGLP